MPGAVVGALYKAGLINQGSVTFPNIRADVSKGPAIERLEGFRFAVKNVDPFWTFAVDNKITFHGALVREMIYDRANQKLVTVRTGINYQNTFDYTNYTFQVEPRVLNDSRSYPDQDVTAAAYPYSDGSQRGKPVISTYGRWQRGRLQVLNFSVSPQRLPSGQRFLTFDDYAALVLTLYVDIAEITGLLGITDPGDYPGTDGVRFLYVRIERQEGNPDEGRIRRVAAIADGGGGTTDFTLARAFAADPDGTGIFELYLSSVQLAIDDERCIGFDAANYLVVGS
jgi:hypothetical protein